MSYRFRDKVADPTKRVVIFEFVPPEPYTQPFEIDRSAAMLVRTLRGYQDLDAVYFPQVVGDENQNIGRPQRVEARTFAASVRAYEMREKEDYKRIKRETKKRGVKFSTDYDPTRFHELELIVSEPFPYRSKEFTDSWLQETSMTYGIGNVIVAGARHRTPDLPGYTVEETLGHIAQMNKAGKTKLFTGALAIDTRENDDHQESRRMVNKTLAGAGFFVTQLFYDPDRIINLLRNYSSECSSTGIQPSRVVLGTSPISSRSTEKVIKSLLEGDVEEGVRKDIFSEDSGIGNRSINQIEDMFKGVFRACRKLDVPLGVCIEHVTESNLRSSLELLVNLPEIWKRFKPDSEIPYFR